MAMKADVVHCKALLAQVRSRASRPIIINRDHVEWGFMWDLLQKHPERERKAGCGVRQFQIVYSSVDSYPPSAHFEIVRIDGSQTDFSYKKCCSSRATLTASGRDASSSAAASRLVPGAATLSTASNSNLSGNADVDAQNFSSNNVSSATLITSRPVAAAAPAGPVPTSNTFTTSPMNHAPSYYYQAMRVAVDQQVRAFKRRALRNSATAVCPVTGERLRWDNSQVHHADLSFRDLVNGWLAEEGIALTDVVAGSADNTASNNRLHAALQASWQHYHAQVSLEQHSYS